MLDTRRIKRSPLAEHEVLLLVEARYGSLRDFRRPDMPFSEIAQRYSVAQTTIKDVIRRFHRNGNIYVKPPYVGRRSLIPREVQESIVRTETLADMRYLPVRERARRHTEEHRIPISVHQLFTIYKRHGVRFKMPKVHARLTDAQVLALIPQRIQFAEQIKVLEDAGHQIIYGDESTFQATMRPGRTWMAEERLVVRKNLQMLRNVTVYGAVTRALPRPIFFMSTTTNAREFQRFVHVLIEKTRHLTKPVLVLDNHRAHKTADNLALMHAHFTVLFQPPYSSEGNSQETVWSIVKREFLKEIYRRTENLTTQLRFEHYLQRLLDKMETRIAPARIVLANRRWLLAHRLLRDREEYRDLPRPGPVPRP